MVRTYLLGGGVIFRHLLGLLLLMGSARTFRRRVGGAESAVAQRQSSWLAAGRVVPGEHLVIDWGVLGGLHVFCAVGGGVRLVVGRHGN